MPDTGAPARYPTGLLEWAGHRSGGVRRLFDQASGRPSGEVVETPLLGRLSAWATEFASRRPATPRVILLVGGPGNGKTEAVEETIRRVEQALGAEDVVRARLRPLFLPIDGSTVPRRVHVDIADAAELPEAMTLTLVQDASVSDPTQPTQSAAALLVDDLERSLDQPSGHAFLACVNRGVLDDALIHATEAGRARVLPLLESIVRAAGMGSGATSCWPLSEHPDVAIWPMDVESLLVAGPGAGSSPADQILNIATDASQWLQFPGCPAGDKCPFCRSRLQLGGDPHRSSFLKILRWYELATGKRWSFRDLFTLVSFLLAGSRVEESATGGQSPCDWAAHLLDLDSGPKGRSETLRLASPFLLMASQYQHALFGQWDRPPNGGIRGALRELKLESNETLLGLHHFLTGTWAGSVPATLRLQLIGLSSSLDPALADPDSTIGVSARSSLQLRDIDARFSRSVRDGLNSIRKYQCLTPLEVDVLQRLADADDALASPEVRRRRSATATRLQALVRDFACRSVRRSLGVRSGVVRNHIVLRDFERVVDGDEALLHGALKRVEALLNENDRFVVPLNTTFGQPAPPEARRVVLTTERQRVRPSKPHGDRRPQSDIRVLSIGPATSPHLVPLTYDLFKSVRDLQDGMMPASLPRTVTALLDTTRARIAGRIVRDEDQLDGAEIKVGSGTETIVHELGRFLIRNDGGGQ
jgi:hypothetical protein